MYEAPRLDEKTFRRIMTSAEQITVQLKKLSRPSLFLTKEEQKSPTCRAVAVIILTDYADPDVPTLARKRRECNETALLPCVVELEARRCVFDGMREIYMLGSTPTPAKNLAIDLIKKVVFGGRLPLKDNDAFDMSQMDAQLPETVLWDYIREFFAEWKSSWRRGKSAVCTARTAGLPLTP